MSFSNKNNSWLYNIQLDLCSQCEFETNFKTCNELIKEMDEASWKKVIATQKIKLQLASKAKSQITNG